MTTSGSYNFSNTHQEIVRRAMRIAGVLGAGETPSYNDFEVVSIALNQMVTYVCLI